jgi:RNA polymerase-binding transcription factor DksA
MATIKKLVNFAAKFFDMAKAQGKDKKKAAAKSKGKPAPKKVSKPAKKAAPKPKKVAKPVKAKSKPAPKKAVKAKPVVKKKAAAKPVVKKVVKKQPVKPAAKAPVKAATKKVEKSNPKPVAKPVVATTVEKKTVQPVVPAKPVLKQEASNVAKPLYKTNTKKMEPETNELNLRYSDEELKEFKDLIEKKLVSSREELKNLKEALENHTESQAGNKAWNMEEGTDTSEMETLMNQIARQHQYIRNLELALVRIENKTYGICRVTGKLIPKERLRIVPHATLSLEAKMTRKSDDVSPGAAVAAPPSDFSEGFED